MNLRSTYNAVSPAGHSLGLVVPSMADFSSTYRTLAEKIHRYTFVWQFRNTWYFYQEKVHYHSKKRIIGIPLSVLLCAQWLIFV